MPAEFERAPEVAEIAHRLIGHFHRHLAGARILYLRRKGDWSTGGKVRLGSAVKLGARDRHLLNADFVITVNGDMWPDLDPKQRLAVVDHELCHCSHTDEGGWVLLHHDVEEFGAVVARHGLWNVDVQTFAAAVQDAPTLQLRLPFGAFDVDESEGEEPTDAPELLRAVGS